MARLYDIYKSKIQKQLQIEFNLRNFYEVPLIEKIVLNMTIGEAVSDPKKLDSALDDLKRISGQKPVIVKAKKSIAGFKLRKGMDIGVKVTLRKKKMYEFLDRLINIALPRVRDFRGLSLKSFDGKGNYSFGLKEQIVFPEIDYNKVDKIRGFDIIICTNSMNNKMALSLLRAFNMPFSNK